jgi:hypothetical protein
MLRILTANNIHIPPTLPTHTLTPIAQLLHRAAHLHAPRLLRTLYPQTVEAQREIGHEWLLGAAERGSEERVAGACWRVDVCEEHSAEGNEEGSGEHFGGVCCGIGGLCGWVNGVG